MSLEGLRSGGAARSAARRWRASPVGRTVDSALREGEPFRPPVARTLSLLQQATRFDLAVGRAVRKRARAVA